MKEENTKEKTGKKKKKGRRILGIIAAVAIAAVIFILIRSFVVRNIYQYNNTADLPVFEEGQSCSLYIYLCGSNLESRQGLAGQNIDELLEADIPDNMNIVIETGGANNWLSHDIANDKIQRYIVKDKELVLVEELENKSMGSGETLTDFLKWSEENYPADRSMLVLWDHGSSSAGCLCYDENFNNDFLEYSELRDALAAAELQKKYDMVVFDACYMSSIEIASLMQDYAHYMVASQKIIPGGGMDYTAMAAAFPENDDETLGRIICDSFLEKSSEKTDDPDVQLSLYRLGNADRVIQAMDAAGLNMLIRQKTIDGSFKMFHSALNAVVQEEGDNVNVVDLLTFADGALKLDFLDHYDEIRLSTDALIPYQVGRDGTVCNGVSVYYPLNFEETELEHYIETSPLENHVKLLDAVYSAIPENPIAFKDSGSINEDGDFVVSLTEESRPYIHSLYYKLWKGNDLVPGTYTLVGEDAVGELSTSLERDFDDLVFSSGFQGKWYCLDSHPLLTSVNPRSLNSSFYAPLNVNGEDIEYNFIRPTMDSELIVNGLLGSILDDEGIPNRVRRNLEQGDTVSVYKATNEQGDMLSAQEEFVLAEDDGKVELLPLEPGKYRLQMIAMDIVGDEIESDYAVFEVTEEGVKAASLL